MARRWLVYGVVVAVVLIAVTAILAAQRKSTDLPPGVLAEMWIPINENAGIALTMWGESIKATPNGVASVGTLMVKSHGSWQKVYLEQASANDFMPIK